VDLNLLTRPLLWMVHALAIFRYLQSKYCRDINYAYNRVNCLRKLVKRVLTLEAFQFLHPTFWFFYEYSPENTIYLVVWWTLKESSLYIVTYTLSYPLICYQMLYFIFLSQGHITKDAEKSSVGFFLVYYCDTNKGVVVNSWFHVSFN